MLKDILRIAELSHKVNEEGNHTVMFSYAGHVKWIEIMAYLGGWEEDKYPDCNIYASGRKWNKDYKKEVKEIENYLLNLLEGSNE